jgi:cytoskeletal protein CcmA (bactofilin family)
MVKFTGRKEVTYENEDVIEHKEQVNTTYIGGSIKIKGNVTSNEAIILEGKIDGNINIAEQITIGKNGQFKGKIKADIVKILGKAKGDISATNRVEICSEGDFDGNVQTQKLIIEDGAIFNGNSCMSDEEINKKQSKNPPK